MIKSVEVFPALLVANKWGGNSTGGVRGRRRREGPGNLFREGTRVRESF